MGCSVSKLPPCQHRSVLDKDPNNFSLTYTFKREHLTEPPFRLPDDLLLLILSLLDSSSLSRMSRVSMYLQNITQAALGKRFEKFYKYPPRIYPGYPTFQAYHRFIDSRKNWILARENTMEMQAIRDLRMVGQYRIYTRLTYLNKRDLKRLPKLPDLRHLLVPAHVTREYHNNPAILWEELRQSDHGLVYYVYRLTRKFDIDFNSYVTNDAMMMLC